MEPYEATRIVYSRVQSLDPENVSKIMGYLLLQDEGEQEMFRLALGSDSLLQSMVIKAKSDLGLSSRSPNLRLPHKLSYLQIPTQLSNGGHFSPQISNHASPQVPYQSPRYSAQSIHQISPHFHSPAQNQRSSYTGDRLHSNVIQRRDDHHNSGYDLAAVHEQHMKLSRLKEKQAFSDQLVFPDAHPQINDVVEGHGSVGGMFPHDHFYPETLAFLNNSRNLTGERETVELQCPSDDLSSPDVTSALAWKPCLYFARGYCKHGNNCRFLHGPSKDSSGSSSPSNGQSWEMQGDEWFGAPGSLEKLELELLELLRGRRSPVSIASLPQLYYERFGKTLQAEGYLTESQRHGKAGYSLTKLLARLRSTVSLIDRPHGQHAVVLTEDEHKYALCRSNSDDINGAVSASSRQIYLTFPAESTFSEEDVSNHFRAFGPVQDVRIPYQQKRMFGFVTFVYSETVKAILAEGNPHYICGARVLVKPYREKGRHCDKKTVERGELSRYPFIQNLNGKCFDISAQNFGNGNDLLPSMQLDQENILELERRRLTEMHISDMRRRRWEAEMAANVASHAAAQHTNHNQSSNNDGYEADELTISAEEIRHMRSNSAFGFLFDELDSDTTDNLLNHENFSSGKERTTHTLPNSPFSSPLEMRKEIAFNLAAKIDQLNLGEKLEMGAPHHNHHGFENEDAELENFERQVDSLLRSFEEQDNKRT